MVKMTPLGKFAKGNLFSTKECYLASAEVGDEVWEDKIFWKKEIPSKVSFMIWSDGSLGSL
ncbi:hypothetical protein BVC80_1747g23 [Macleaya cordata]|uniref:Uncharacterized protein n=1 Tax=Macleaya cordata TaxID=56857 RepID=A0A200QKT0_MACCD|nr:hypothetical protein BVC80_1747g23 [Macleaya cordata]